MLNITNIINDMCFEDERFESIVKQYDIHNPYHIELLIQECKKEEVFFGKLEYILNEHRNEDKKLSDEDIKKVFLKLKNREADPAGSFDKSGRFYLTDYELVDVRTPSAAYPYSQMNAGRTAKFVKSLSDKYKCETLEDLEKVAYGRKRTIETKKD